MDIFSVAKTNSSTSKPSKNAKPEIVLDEKKYTGISSLIDEVEQARQIKKNAETELKLKESAVNEVFKAEWCNLYEKSGVRPDSVIFTGEKSSAKLMFISTDKYTKVSEPQTISEVYGEEVIEESVTYSFDTDLLMKHYDTIVKLFADCNEIPVEDKAKLIKAEQSFSIKKGTINRLHTFKGAIKSMVDAFGVVFQTKSVS